jgi:hypothetical protein
MSFFRVNKKLRLILRIKTGVRYGHDHEEEADSSDLTKKRDASK